MVSPFAQVPGESERPTIILIDGSSYVFRAYHAVPHLSNKKGIATNAVYGFTNMLLKAIREARPTHLGVALDRSEKTFRSEIDPNYKANRPETPADLGPQFGLVRQLLEAMSIPLLEVPTFEADDVLGTLARRAHEQGFRVVLVTGDKDFMQLVGPEVLLFDSMRDKWTGPTEVVEKLGVPPDKAVDLFALCGDAVDNVPGVPGVGVKTAAQLLQRFGSLDGLLANLDAVDRPKLRESLRANVAQIRMARRLVEIRCDVELTVTPRDLERRPPRAAELARLFEELEFTRLLRELPGIVEAGGGAGSQIEETSAISGRAWTVVTVVESAEGAEAAIGRLRQAKAIGIFVEVAGAGPFPAELCGVALAVEGATPTVEYFPLAHVGEHGRLAEVSALRALAEDPAVAKIGFGLKRAWTALGVIGIQLEEMAFDAELACYLLNPGRREHSLADVAREHLGYGTPVREVARARPRESLGALPAEFSAPNAGSGAEAALRLWPVLERQLREQGLLELFERLEMPLVPILGEMERHGVLVDAEVLNRLSTEAGEQLTSLERRIFELAGHELNVASSRQLAQLLFDELHLPVIRRTKTGPSTDQEVLEKLAQQHELPKVVLEHRSLAKLKGTYLDALPQLVDPRDGRIHTTFNQATAATGRLSSSDPNLQNIPTRTELGRRIREAFIAPMGHALVSADYSQIELRVLAHVSGDASLRESFARREDVHGRTAAEVFGVEAGAVTAEMRRAAKAINFGIAYGLSAFGLAQRLDLPPGEAQAIIDRYFQRYSGVRRWLDETIEVARRDGAVGTIFGRRRLLPDIHSRNPAVRQAAERMAVNTPIQGAAADLIKRAMLRTDRMLRERKLKARLILQVHDELVFEAPLDETDAVAALAREAMEGAGDLAVPLEVVVGIGRTWAAVH
ncbi:MAG: DNA polymerase I [Deltaproteobacteria bacterium]